MAPRRTPAEVHSLWLRPAGAARRRLALLIARLARRCGTAPFEPHVTLLGGIALPRSRAVEKTSALARALRPFAVRLSGTGHGTAFFRCLYLRAAGSDLRRARAEALRTFREGSGGSDFPRIGGRFRPHLSLVYGRLPAADRRRIAREIGESPSSSFMARDLALVRTSGEVRSWRVVAVRRLG